MYLVFSFEIGITFFPHKFFKILPVWRISIFFFFRGLDVHRLPDNTVPQLKFQWSLWGVARHSWVQRLGLFLEANFILKYDHWWDSAFRERYRYISLSTLLVCCAFYKYMGMEATLWSPVLPSRCCERHGFLLVDSGEYKEDVMHGVFVFHWKEKKGSGCFNL